MKKYLFILFMLFNPLSLTAAEQSGQYSIDDLEYDCTRCSEDSKCSECIYCNGLITGVAATMDILEKGVTFCPPNKMDTKLARNMFRKWAKDLPPESKEDSAVAGIIVSMQKSFPCKAKDLPANKKPGDAKASAPDLVPTQNKPKAPAAMPAPTKTPVPAAPAPAEKK